ncbi:MAG: hypothetical protein IAI48_09900, partial [Candidatus Eremiobacteraeota bacterium]|nr:hypothetical protein [Candidatus Eremiobacteraeota bacterium]
MLGGAMVAREKYAISACSGASNRSTAKDRSAVESSITAPLASPHRRASLRAVPAHPVPRRGQMLDLTLLRRDPERVRRAAARRAYGAGFVDDVVELDTQLRAARTTAEGLQAEKNELTARISRAADRAAEAARLRPEIAALDARIVAATGAIPPLEERIDAILADVPNLLDDSVPDGAGEDDNVLVRTAGTLPTFAFEPKPHWEVGETLGI